MEMIRNLGIDVPFDEENIYDTKAVKLTDEVFALHQKGTGKKLKPLLSWHFL
jgi:hypothetical protein